MQLSPEEKSCAVIECVRGVRESGCVEGGLGGVGGFKMHLIVSLD